MAAESIVPASADAGLSSTRPFRDFALIGAGRVFSILAALCTVRLLTTILSPNEVGRLNIINATYGWFGLVLLNPVGMYVNRKLIAWNHNGTGRPNVQRYLKFVFLIAILSFAIVGIVVTTSGLGIAVSPITLLLIVSASIICVGGGSGVVSFLNLLDFRIPFIVFSNLSAWGGLLISLAMVRTSSASAEAWLCGQLLASGLIFVVAGKVLFSRMRPIQESKDALEEFQWRPVFCFAWPLALAISFYWLQTQGYRFILEYMAGTEALGRFVVGFGLGANMMITFESFVSQYYHPILYRGFSSAVESTQTQAWNYYAAFLFPITVIVSAVVSCNASVFVRLMLGSQFQGVEFMLILGSIAEGIRVIYSATSMVAHAKLKMASLIFPGILGSTVSLASVWILVPHLGLLGAGIGLIFGWFTSVIYLRLCMARILQIAVPWEKMGKAVGLSLPLFLLSALSVYRHTPPETVQLCLTFVGSLAYGAFCVYLCAKDFLKNRIPLP